MPPIDAYKSRPRQADEPSGVAHTIVPHDTNDLPFTTRGIYFGGTGNVTVQMMNGVTQLFSNLPGGFVLPIRVTKVLSTGTTATLMVALA